ncbi:sugar phosphate isomerase/epimerase [Paenibacillus glycanilyticus]|uniref:sugar phosphate isomerase/epimerase family protein n=1 Tax=Paenibacillus glycanilyticus TaxID=126569 RepID=UPI00203EB141|nr:TIM barrel protein [Paenibacillus glycanilyticus]MCM3628636.1 sugar phosphate isomerase/epimerase [Paenibacillus glycanilyticus]
MSYLSLSTWSLHRNLGPLRWTVWNEETGVQDTSVQEQPLLHSLLELPAEAAKRGYQAVEICHFHFPSTDSSYLKQVKQAFEQAGLSFDTLLLDYGDITSSNEVRVSADLALIREWIDIASQSGAKQIRVVAGEASPSDEEAISLSAARLSELSEYGRTVGVKVITENFKALTSTGASCMKLLGAWGEHAATITDFGNFRGALKYEEIALTTPLSVSVHVKPQYDENGYPDEAELRRCLDTVSSAGFNGAFVLIYDGPGDMWEGMERVKRIASAYISS